MCVILPLFVVAVKPVVYDCGLIVDNSTDRGHQCCDHDDEPRDGSAEHESRENVRREGNEIVRESVPNRVAVTEGKGIASLVGVVALVAHATSIQPDALGCKPLSRYFVDLSQKVLSPCVAGGCA